MTMVVSAHVGASAVGGATNGLFIAAGYVFAKYQLQTVLLKDSAMSILSSVAKIVLPTFLCTSVLQFWVNDFRIENLLLIGNFTPPNVGAAVANFWFVNVLIQILLALAILLSIKKCRQFASTTPFVFGTALLAISAVLLFAIPYVWDANYLYNRVPHVKLWLFTIGWCLFLCSKPSEKVAIAASLIIISIFSIGIDSSRFYMTVVPGLLLLGFPHVLLLSPLHRIVYAVGGASLFIYLTHFQFINVLHRLGVDGYAVLDVAVGLIGGFVVWQFWEAAQRKFSHFTSTRKDSPRTLTEF